MARAREIVSAIGVQHGSVMLDLEEEVIHHALGQRLPVIGLQSQNDEVTVPTVHFVEASAGNDVWAGQIEQPRSGQFAGAHVAELVDMPEMADDSTYYPDVIRWLVAHPKESGASFLVKGSENPDAAEAATLKGSSCDVKASVVCARAWAAGYRLTRDFYLGDRAMRESGFDPSFRFGPFDGATHHYAPVCLNSLLYRYERDLEHFAHLLAKPQDATHWDHRAKARDAAIQRYLWRPKEGVFADYDFVHARPSSYTYISSLYPLWAGVATREEAKQMVDKLDLFERPGGLSMSYFNSGMQWDEPFGWAPTNWISVAGLEAEGFHGDAARIARDFDATIDAGFAKDGTIREKYNVVSSSSNVQVSAGYKTNEIGFGWSNAAYLKMKEVTQRPVAPPAN